ncbi:NAD binding Rossmann fold oxidoreductase [Dacryopinax primogenitus]|uniref:D-xylose 1-dehydrogenase (NADP(+), D-xylono-1,5-lactone-forming) n=1 Tax=Dacryopinax primogenitus (strain DJM 731) TaxID=1858805 RepID=M5FPU5_DACPD|nr:NAD binding Rossmann fold oxidoreductase [Dacryopinax primogenitus]EJT98785.1 NAD binding Rossmann fold oxidoreductase [Dacryopinax primogenitus]
MATLIYIFTFLHQCLYSSRHVIPLQKKSPMTVRWGVLGSTAMIDPAVLIDPALTHNECFIVGFASPEKKDAEQLVRTYGRGIARAYDGYAELVADETIDAVYIPLPNGLHYEWASKALDAGKHVLLDNPITSNAEQAGKLVAKAEEKGLVLLEGYHWMFHPAAYAIKMELESGAYGKILRTEAWATTLTGTVPKGDPRWNYDLAGGALMDQAYAISATRYFLSAGAPSSVVSAEARLSKSDPRVDSCMEAELEFDLPQGKVKSKIVADMDRPNLAFLVPRLWEQPSIEIETERATLYFYNFTLPHLYHYIAITDKKFGKRTYKQFYQNHSAWSQHGKYWWSSYRWQIEAFVDKIRGREVAIWVSGQNSIDQMTTIDMVYQRAGLPLRG